MRLVRAAIVAGARGDVRPERGAATAIAQTDRAAVVKTYADIGQAMYEDALARARVLQKAVRALVETPSEATLQAAREAWLSAREPYMQTEVFRFGNSVVDEWEGKVNAWPLDEGLIDYVEGQYGGESDSNPYYTANVIANRRLKVGSKSLDACDDHQEGSAGPARDRRRRGQRGHRLPRDRVPPLGAGSERDRPRRGQPAVDGLRPHELHARQLRPARPVPHRGEPSSWSRISPGSRVSSPPAGRRARI